MIIFRASGKLFQNICLSLLLTALLAASNLYSQSLGPGYALHFSGSYVDIPNFGNVMPTNEITIEFWQRVSGTTFQSTFSLNPDQTTNRINASVPWLDGTVYWDFGNINNGGRLAYTPPVSIAGSWQHFALVASQSGNFMYIYRNGVLEAQKLGMTPYVRGAYDLGLGILFSGPYYFGGDLDEVRIWNVARTANQIQSNMNRSLVGNESGLVAYWRFDEGAGTSAFDATGHGFTGTLINQPAWIVSTAPILFPMVATLPASGITTNAALLNGSVEPNGADTTAWFQYGATTKYGSITSPTLISETNVTPVAISNLLLTLTPATTYHFQLLASNSIATNAGSDKSFTTQSGAAPSIGAVAVTSISTTNADLLGSITPNGLDTSAWFQYGSATNYGNLTLATNISGTNLLAMPISDLINGLAPFTSYHFQLVASNHAGVSMSSDVLFNTLGLPKVITLAAMDIRTNSATLNGSVDPNGFDSMAWFQYGLTTNYESTTPTNSFIYYGPPFGGAATFNAPLTGLSLGLVYHYRLVATNSQGTNYGADLTFVPFNTNCSLAGLTFSAGVLSYPFVPSLTAYSAGLNTNITQVTVTAILADSNATLLVRANHGPYQPLASGSPSPAFAVIPGFNLIDLFVTAQNGVTTQLYTLAIGISGPNISVTTTNFSGSGSLGSSIKLANLTPGPHVINLPANAIFNFTTPDNFWYGPNALPPIASDITIEGNGSTLLRATNGRLRFFYVGADPSNPATSNYNSPGPGKLTLRHLILTNGLALGGDGAGGGAGMGGAIFSQGMLILDGVTLTGNTAQGGGGGEYGQGGGGLGQDGAYYGAGGGFGGSVFPAGSMGGPSTTNGCGGGGGFAVSDNASGPFGGGIQNGLGDAYGGGNGSGGGSGPGPANPNTFQGGNFGFGGQRGGGGLGGSGGGVGGGGGPGSYASDIYGNGGGGGFGGGGGGCDRDPAGGPGGFGGGGGPGAPGGFGGGAGSYSQDSSGAGGAGMGGAIFNHNGVVLITNSTFSANEAQGGHGAFSFVYGGATPGGGGSAFGGAIFNLNGIITLLNSTLASNVVGAGLSGTAPILGTTNIVIGPPGVATGGAMYNLVYDCALVRTAKVTVINSILAGSVGGLDVVNSMPATILSFYTITLTNLGSAIFIATEPNLIQTFTNTGGSFTNNGVITNTPLLGPLANNGGPTPTMALLPGSPAIDAGDNSNAPATDQRGEARIWNGKVDLGAVEFQTPLSFTAFNISSTGQLQLKFTGDPTLGYTIVTTTNLNQPLTNWTVLGAATQISNGVFQFTDTSASNAPLHYYRVRHP